VAETVSKYAPKAARRGEIMRRRHDWIAVLALLPMVIGLTACEVRSFRVLIPDYDASSVEGLRLWVDDGRGLTEHIAINFAETVEARVGEVVMYEFTVDGQELGVTMPAVVKRDQFNQVTLSLNLLDFGAGGEYYISTFNEFGDSPLAEGSFTL
jgi:hypothetical protein